MFRVEQNENEHRLTKFKELCDNENLYRCYKNKLEYNCVYNDNIEKELKRFTVHIEPDWLNIID